MISEYTTTTSKATCHCCGYKTLQESNAYEICPICFWEDDPAMAHIVDIAGGANTVSLREAQRNFKEFGASERRVQQYVRQVLPHDERDENWTPIHLSDADSNTWGRRLATYVADLEKDIEEIRRDKHNNKEWRIIEATRWFYDAAEWLYRIYKFPETNNDQYCDFTSEIDTNEFQDWVMNQLGNWSIVRNVNS